MKMGICGARSHGFSFLELFGLHPLVEAVSLADINPEIRHRARRAAGVDRVHETFDELVDSDVDAIGVFTPPWSHAEQSIRALEAGKAVVCACPAALTLDELRRLVDAVERTGRIYMTCETSYYHPIAMYSRRAWREGRFGQFVYGEGEYYYRPHAYPFWMRDLYANMPPMLYPTHSTAHVVSVTGERFERVTCVGVSGLHPDAEARQRRDEWRHNLTSNMTMLGKMSGGGSTRINEMRNVGCKGEQGSILGTLASIRQHSGNITWTNGLSGEEGENLDLTALWRDPARHPHTEPATRLPGSYAGLGLGHEGSHRFLADEFVRAVAADARPHNHVWIAARYCAPGIVACESLSRGSEWMEVPDFGSPADQRKELDC